MACGKSPAVATAHNDLWVDCDVTGIGNRVDVVVLGGGMMMRSL
jgi:hypothetical protein